MKVSFFKSVKDVANPFHRDIDFCLDRIQNGASKELVLRYRDTKDNTIKNKLPGVCFTGTFSHRSKSGLIEQSGLCILDFDKFKDEQDAVNFKEHLKNYDYIFAAFISPSGNGVKALARIPIEPANYKYYFTAIGSDLDSIYFDHSTSDISRICYESWDSDIYVNKEATLFTKLEYEDYSEIGKTQTEILVPLDSESQIIDRLFVWFDKKYGMDSGSRNSNLFKLAMAFNDFGINEITAENQFSKFAQEDFNQNEIDTIIKSAYRRGKVSFKTKFFEDNNTKKTIQKQILSGTKQKDIVNKLEREGISVDSETIDKVKESMEVDEFWNISDKGRISLSPLKFKLWLEQHNFMKYYPAGGNTYTFIYKNQNFIEETNEKRIKDFVLEYLLENNNISSKAYDYMAGNPQFFTSNYLSFLRSADIRMKEDTHNECYIYYRNCTLQVTAESIKEIDYTNIGDEYVWKNQIIDRDYILTDHHGAIFREFIWLISGQSVAKYNSFKSVIGYLLHTFKTSANNKAIIFNDETISENPNGGSGKGLFWNAISKMKKVSMIDGKSFEFTKSFPYQTVSTDCQLLVFDDVKKNFNFESLFSLITEGITLEYKGQDAIKLPITKSPKILITTNYTVGGVGGSFERRKFEVEMSSYFNANNTPLDHFGHLLFDEWSDEEWHKFDAYMVNCLQYYLVNGLVSSEFGNLHTRKFIKETSYEFYEWVQDPENIKINERLYKGTIFENFLNEYPDFKKFLSQKRFKSWLQLYAAFIFANYNEGKSIDGRWFEINKTEFNFQSEIPF